MPLDHPDALRRLLGRRAPAAPPGSRRAATRPPATACSERARTRLALSTITSGPKRGSVLELARGSSSIDPRTAVACGRRSPAVGRGVGELRRASAASSSEPLERQRRAAVADCEGRPRLVAGRQGLGLGAGAVAADGLVLDVVGDHRGERDGERGDDEEEDQRRRRGDPRRDGAGAGEHERHADGGRADPAGDVDDRARVVGQLQGDLGDDERDEAEPQQHPAAVRRPPPAATRPRAAARRRGAARRAPGRRGRR